VLICAGVASQKALACSLPGIIGTPADSARRVFRRSQRWAES
jgi:hypothetical protein